MATICLSQVLSIWRSAAIGRLGKDFRPIHLTSAEWLLLRDALLEQGIDLSPQEIIDYGQENGFPFLATDWPAHDNYKVELESSSQLYDMLIRLLRSCWREATQYQPPELGILGNAAGLAKLWQQENERDGKLAFERCRDRLNMVVLDWQAKLARRLNKGEARQRRKPKGILLRYDYWIIDDESEQRVTAYFQKLRVTSQKVLYEDNDRALHDLMVLTQKNEEDTFNYDQLARALKLGIVPSKLNQDDRRAPCATIGKAISRYCKKWEQANKDVQERLKGEKKSVELKALQNQGPPLQSVDKGVWQIKVRIETKGLNDRED